MGTIFEIPILTQKETTIQGNVAVMFGFFPSNFGHILHDNVPLLAYLKSIVLDDTKFLLPNTRKYKDLITFIDPEFIQHVHFYDPNEVITVQDGTLTVVNFNAKFLNHHGNTLWRYLRH